MIADQTEVHLLGISLGFFIRVEKSVDFKAPDISEAHADIIILGKGFLRIVELRHDTAEITQRCTDMIVERFSCKREGISPGEGEFITGSSQVCAVHLRRRRAIDARECDTGRQHVFRITDISFCGEIEPVVEEGHIQSEVVLLGRFPSQVGSIRRTQSRIFRHRRPVTEGESLEIIDADGTEISIIRNILVAQATERETELEIVHRLLGCCEERFL